MTCTGHIPRIWNGTLGYFDTFAGMVPCRVLAVNGPSGIGSTAQRVTIKLTASRGAYKAGEVITTSGLHVCPRNAVYTVNGIQRIGRYEFMPAEEMTSCL